MAFLKTNLAAAFWSTVLTENRGTNPFMSFYVDYRRLDTQ